MKSATAVSSGLRELAGLPDSLGARGHAASDLPASAAGREGQRRSRGQRSGPPRARATRPVPARGKDGDAAQTPLPDGGGAGPSSFP